MPRAFGSLVLLLVASGTIVQAQTPSTVKIPDGTAVRLVLTDDLSSATSQVDNPIRFDVAEDVKVGNTVVLPKGSSALGHVVEVEPKKRLGRAGKLNFSVDHVKAPDGTNVRLRSVSSRTGKDKTGTVIVGTVLLSPLFLLMHGKDINIPRGTEINAYIDGDREVAVTAPPVAVQPASSSPATATVNFKSDPDGADITVDGKFVGNTPSAVQLSPGDHSIVIAKSSFASWTKTVSVAAGSAVNVSATLDKEK